MAVEVAAARRRIIRRPRLTSILDESSARVRMLVAPAGYGKTTLAREWLGEDERNDVWYRGGPASADVAALAVGIAEAAGQLIPGAGSRMSDRLRATGQPEEDVEILTELFAADVQEWPSDAWLAFDDYHFAMDSVASERFVDLLTQQTPMQLLITSRRRPSWATARRILYGEILEIDRRALAMDDAEAREVLGREHATNEELITRARGWPAVLGLAALAETVDLPAEDIPLKLHAFFAEEIFHATDVRTRRDLATLALAPTISTSFVESIFGPAQAAEVVEAGLRLGVLTVEDAETLAIHPLFREHLLVELPDPTGEVHSRITKYFLDEAQWDSAFEVAALAPSTELMSLTFAAALDPLLRDGRLATVQRWIDTALAKHVYSGIIDLAEAELAFRQGDPARAYILASQSAGSLGDVHLQARAHIRAGHSALLASRESDGLKHFRSALALSPAWEQRREALVGLYFAASELGAPDAVEALRELEASDDHKPDAVLRLESLRLTRATRVGGISKALEEALPKLHLAERVTDPLGLTAFLHMLATALNHAARYDEAFTLAEHQLDVASQYRLELPVVHARLNQALSHLGSGAFSQAARTLNEIRSGLPTAGDAYLEASSRAIMCRLLIARKEFDNAVALTEDAGETISSPPLRSDYLSARALALVCAGHADEAGQALNQAEAAFPSSIELQVLSPCVTAIGRARTSGSDSAHRASIAAWSAARETGNFDSFVCAFRAEPALLGAVAETPAFRTGLGELLARTNEGALAKQLGVSVPRPAAEASLTPRELEIVHEVERGLSNREIATRLFISEATVKAHLRHIYEKLGVRTRTELMAQRARRR